MSIVAQREGACGKQLLVLLHSNQRPNKNTPSSPAHKDGGDKLRFHSLFFFLTPTFPPSFDEARRGGGEGDWGPSQMFLPHHRYRPALGRRRRRSSSSSSCEVSISSLGRWTGEFAAVPHYTPLRRLIVDSVDEVNLINFRAGSHMTFSSIFSPTSKTSISDSKMGRSE